MKKDIMYIRNKQIIARQIQGEFVALDINAGKLYKLNSTAKAVWKFLSKQRALDEVIRKIVTEFDVSESVAQKEVKLFIKEHLGSLFLQQ